MGCGAEEHSYRAPKQLVFPINNQWENAGTIISTNGSPGKGWTCVDRGDLLPPGCQSIIAVWWPKGMIIIIAKQPLRFETLLKAVGRQGSFARGQPAFCQL